MTTFDASMNLQGLLTRAFDTALTTGGSHAVETVAAVRARRPERSPEQVRKLIEKRYMATVASSGAVAGGIPIPGVGVAASVLDAVGFVGLSVRLVLIESALAGDPLDDVDRLRTLALGAMIGQGAFGVIQEASKRTGKYWGVKAARAVPLETIRAINNVLGPDFVTRYGTRQGIIVLGKAFPAGFGALLGAGGNAALGAAVIKGAHLLCGPTVEAWDEVVVAADSTLAFFNRSRPGDDGDLMPAAA